MDNSFYFIAMYFHHQLFPSQTNKRNDQELSIHPSAYCSILTAFISKIVNSFVTDISTLLSQINFFETSRISLNLKLRCHFSDITYYQSIQISNLKLSMQKKIIWKIRSRSVRRFYRLALKKKLPRRAVEQIVIKSEVI